MTLQPEDSRPNKVSTATAGGIVALCEAARELEEGGRYADAAALLSDYWPGPGSEPEGGGGLTERAHLYLRAGSLTGWLGKLRGIAGYQELAKDLLGRAASLFEAAGDREGEGEALVAMSVAYWRAGAYDEARALLDTVVHGGAAVGRRVSLSALLNRSMVERSMRRFSDAAESLRAAEPLLAPEDSPLTHGRFHNGRASTYHFVAVATGLADLFERAEHEYVTTSYYAEVAGNAYLQGVVENNLALVYLQELKLEAADAHAEKSIGIFERAGQGRAAASPFDTRARVFIAGGDFAAAERCADEAVTRLLGGDESAALAEALVTRGVARARLSRRAHARADLEAAAEIASRVGDDAGAGRARLALLEELLPHLGLGEARAAYDEADRLLASVQDASLATRLRKAAGSVLRVTGERLTDAGSYSWEGFTLDAAVRDYKGLWVERALRDAGGIVSQAARLLGLATHQTLFEMLKADYGHLRVALQTTFKRRSVMGRGRRPRRAARVAAPRLVGCCRAESSTFIRLALSEGDDALAARGPRGGDSLVADRSSRPAAGDLVIVCDGGRKLYGYYRPEGDGFRLTYDSDEFANRDFTRPRDGVEIMGAVVGYFPKGSRTLKALAPR